MYGRGGRKLEINIPSQQIYANSKGGLINEGGVILSEYGNNNIVCDIMIAILMFNKKFLVSTIKLATCSDYNLNKCGKQL